MEFLVLTGMKIAESIISTPGWFYSLLVSGIIPPISADIAGDIAISIVSYCLFLLLVDGLAASISSYYF